MSRAAIASRRHLAATLSLALPFALAYAPVLVELVRQWADDPNYAHGFFVVPMAAWLARRRRTRYHAAPSTPDATGFVLLSIGALLYLAGSAAAELFTARVSLVLVLGGLLWAIEGRARARALAFPVVFLFCMVPLPYVVYYQLTFPLQIESSRMAAAILGMAGMPVVREGNILSLEGYSLEVVTACSGLRSIMTLGTMAIFLTDFMRLSTWSKVLLAASALPVAVAANVARLATTAGIAAIGGAQAAESFLHELSGIVVFITGLVVLFVTGKVLQWIERARR
ncbi:MAG TPA: exosortase/archaeosortase family protein [Candidatus Krumholzibacteria bacterium]|nr:exosortase/archaeosortase family protein [Candidatus Krumholzibacteria bacterium]